MKKNFLRAFFWAALSCCAGNGHAQIQNTKYGIGALNNNTGDGNTAVGYYAMILYATNSGSNNTAAGAFSLQHNTSGSYNSAFGHSALYSGTTGSYNTATGNRALYFNTEGTHNTASGNFSLYSNTEGSYNTASGEGTLYSNLKGSANTAYGSFSLFSNKNGANNTATGHEALYANTSGNFNTANGDGAMSSNTAGSYNTAVGVSAMFLNQTGSYNTALGYAADFKPVNRTNATAIGFGATGLANDQVMVGNTAVTSIGGYANWTTFPSDGRFKKNIKADIPGLSFINLLKPVSYTLDIRGINKVLGKETKAGVHEKRSISAAETESIQKKEKVIYNGFIAQEVEKSAKQLSYPFSGVDVPENDSGLYGIRYGDFVVPLVKAVQELSKMNDEKEARMNELQKQLDEVKSMIVTFKNASLPNANTPPAFAGLDQNVPNPFSYQTTIGYKLPQTFTTAQIRITDNGGKLLRQLSLSGAGKGTVQVDTTPLPSGIYHYSLVIDGKVTCSKQMACIK